MSSTILLKRGSSTNVDTAVLQVGEPAFATDTGKLYIGLGGTDKVLVNADLNLGSAAHLDAGTAPGNVPVIGGDGKLSPGIMPDIAITDVFVVASEAEMLALDAQVGDVAIRTDVNKSYILAEAPPSNPTNWIELSSAGYVTSVAGKTGDVILQISDIVNLETELMLKAPLVDPAFSGQPTAPTANPGTSSAQIATTQFVQEALLVIDGGTW